MIKFVIFGLFKLKIYVLFNFYF